LEFLQDHGRNEKPVSGLISNFDFGGLSVLLCFNKILIMDFKSNYKKSGEVEEVRYKMDLNEFEIDSPDFTSYLLIKEM
jgi:hypothetical protein